MRRHTFTALAVVPLLAFGLSACGSGGKAAAGRTTAKADGQEQALKFVHCMRAHGVDMPDPEPGGLIKMGVKKSTQGGGDVAGVNKTMEAAQKACRQYLPNGGQPPKLSSADLAKMREFAKCMREHGIPMADPGDDGRITVKMTGGPGAGAKQLDDQAAQKACQHLMPKLEVKQ
jgi:hypothetical protein